MKTKVVLSEKAQKFSAVVTVAAIAGVLGMGGLVLTSGSASAVTKTTNPGSTQKTQSSSSSSSSTTTTPTPSADTTPTPSTGTSTATTPDTGFFTGEGEFTRSDGIILLTGGLATVLAGYMVIRNRKTIFRGRVKFDR